MQFFVSFVMKIKNGLALLLNKIKKNKVIKKNSQHSQLSGGWIKLHFQSAYNLCITTTALLKQNTDLTPKETEG